MTSVGRDDSARRLTGFRPLGEFLFLRRKRNQNAAGGGLRWASPPIVAPPPDPRLRGIPLHPSAKFPARKIRLRVLIPSGPLGPGSVQNSGLCHFTAAPGSDQPWQRVRDRARAGRRRFHEPGTGESGTRPYGALRDPSPLIQRPERAAAGKFPVKQGSG